MGRVSSAGDNAAMESFYSLLQNNVLNRQSWATREQLRVAIVTWIERTYHRRRRHLPVLRALGRLTPIEYEAVIGYNRLATQHEMPQPPSTRLWAAPPHLRGPVSGRRIGYRHKVGDYARQTGDEYRCCSPWQDEQPPSASQ
jgi:putative transposase